MLISWVKGSCETFTMAKMSFDWWMSAEWAARDDQPILPIPTNPCITRAAHMVNKLDDETQQPKVYAKISSSPPPPPHQKKLQIM